mmetsp:Transcript_41491/g.103140  ORF Transcript_41491/g.103140 Transcript_41491/m.103140 type:complete len:247 (-) Transcript_41491:198-938(-)
MRAFAYSLRTSGCVGPFILRTLATRGGIGTSLVYLEAEYPGHVMVARWLRYQITVGLHEQMAKRSPEVCSIHIGLPGSTRVVNILTPRTEDFGSVNPWKIALTDRKCRLPLTIYARAPAEVELLEFLMHQAQTSWRENVARMHKPIQQLRCRFDGVLLVFGEAHGCGTLDIKDGIEGILIVWDLRAKPCEVEVVLQELGLNLREKLVAFERAVPLHPGRVFSVARRLFGLFSLRLSAFASEEFGHL